jgi:hypothetical protein
VNRQIVTSVLIIMGAGAYRVLVIKPAPGKHTLTLTRVIVGGYMLAIIASIIDLVGGLGAQLSNMLLGLAVMTALFAVIPDLFSRFSQRRSAAAVGASSTKR